MDEKILGHFDYCEFTSLGANMFSTNKIFLLGSLIHLVIQPISCLPYFECPTGTKPMNPAVIHGKRFYDEVTNEYIPIKGIAYYPRANDGPIAEYDSEDYFTDDYRHVWEPHIQYFKDLDVNTLRIYAVDPSKSHDGFMCALQDAGIRVIVGLLAQCENCGIGPGDPPSCYSPQLKQRGQYIINEFSKYPNTLAFSAGNEVGLYSDSENRLNNAPCQKKFLSDMRKYVSGCKDTEINSILPRKVPIGIVTQDVNRDDKALYYNCISEDMYDTTEWYGINAYQHCDGEAEGIDFLPGWIQMKADFTGYNLPVPTMIAEFGCIERNFPKIDGFEAQRTWLQIDALFSSDYQEVFCGGVVFEFSTEKIIVEASEQGNPYPYEKFMKLNYGIGYLSPENCDHDETTCTYIPYPEYETLKTAFGNVDTSYIPKFDDSTSENIYSGYPECPSNIASISDFEWPTDVADDLPCYVLNTPSPTMEIVPSVAPTMTPTEDPLKCGRPETCTDKILNSNAGDFTCGERIQYLVDSQGLPIESACKKIAVDEFPRVCGRCNPYSSDSSQLQSLGWILATVVGTIACYILL